MASHPRGGCDEERIMACGGLGGVGGVAEMVNTPHQARTNACARARLGGLSVRRNGLARTGLA